MSYVVLLFPGLEVGETLEPSITCELRAGDCFVWYLKDNPLHKKTALLICCILCISKDAGP